MIVFSFTIQSSDKKAVHAELPFFILPFLFLKNESIYAIMQERLSEKKEITMKKDLHLICNAPIDPVWQWEWEEGACETLSTFITTSSSTNRTSILGRSGINHPCICIITIWTFHLFILPVKNPYITF